MTLVGLEHSEDSLMVAFPEMDGKGVCVMDTREVLTLVLVIFAVLTYLDNHYKK